MPFNALACSPPPSDAQLAAAKDFRIAAWRSCNLSNQKEVKSFLAQEG